MSPYRSSLVTASSPRVQDVGISFDDVTYFYTTTRWDCRDHDPKSSAHSKQYRANQLACLQSIQRSGFETLVKLAVRHRTTLTTMMIQITSGVKMTSNLKQALQRLDPVALKLSRRCLKC